MNPSDKTVPVEVFAGKQWEAAMVKSLLENAEIEAYLIDEFTGTLAPWYTAGGGAGAVKVLVPGGDAEKAVLVVKEFEEGRDSII